MRGHPEIKLLSREHDEMILDMLAMQDAGFSCRQIAKNLRVSPGSVVRATNAVREESQ